MAKTLDGIRVSAAVSLTVVTCYKCGTPFGMESDLHERAKRTGENFYCPNGHCQRYTETTEMKLRKKLETAETDARWYRERAEQARRDAEQERRSKAAYKGQLTKTRKRVGNGVCPCCNRTFTNLQRHMHSQHPDFVGEATNED